MLNPPCKNCPDRRVGCHSVCEGYLKFKTERDEIIKRRRAEMSIDDDYRKVRQKHKER